MSDIMILDQAVLKLFCLQVSFTTHMPKSENVDNSVKYLHNLPKVNQAIYTLDTNCMPYNMTLAQAVIKILWSKGPL